jgi:hypothetical protein
LRARAVALRLPMEDSLGKTGHHPRPAADLTPRSLFPPSQLLANAAVAASRVVA